MSGANAFIATSEHFPLVRVLPGEMNILRRARCCKDTAVLKRRLRQGRFPSMADTLRLYQSIAAMDKKAPLPSLRSQKPTWDKAAALAKRWELNQLARRLEELGTHG